jgi:predicted GIY-YIG superfamily endonuclease
MDFESIPDPNRHYVGFTEDLRQRLTDHNAGKNVSTASIGRGVW